MPLKSLFTLLVCLTLLLQNAMALGLAAVSMEKAQRFTTEFNDSSNDIELICTGNTMRWISLSATEHAGEFVYVSVDISKIPVVHIDCTNSLLSDLPNAVTAPDFSLPLITLVRFNNLATAIAQRPYTAYAYATGLSRAPPLS
ncbi:hypothetical protein [Alteromonas stellipolaris]|uniref:Uncharacterized protein n=1 Tax=Alteromonas stellipolaris TaxID=233316 RepID=A0ABN4LV22_9ALTE|nr:hypothetical protein [Alteromonas stellipolaris]ALM92780.1 hypothetical protein AOR13_3787 [Alteromonas stellipolaris LMG 21856]AMJ75997.1 hypothetical protein AVL57_19740 [Alteromonas stellipolaris]